MTDDPTRDDPPTSFTISDTIRTLGEHVQADIRQVMDAETDVVSGIVGDHQLKIMAWMDAVAQQILVLEAARAEDRALYDGLAVKVAQLAGRVQQLEDANQAPGETMENRH